MLFAASKRRVLSRVLAFAVSSLSQEGLIKISLGGSLSRFNLPVCVLPKAYAAIKAIGGPESDPDLRYRVVAWAKSFGVTDQEIGLAAMASPGQIKQVHALFAEFASISSEIMRVHEMTSKQAGNYLKLFLGEGNGKQAAAA